MTMFAPSLQMEMATVGGTMLMGSLELAIQLATAAFQLVLGSKKWRYIKPSGNSTCGLTEDGEIYCWGRNHSIFTAHGYQ